MVSVEQFQSMKLLKSLGYGVDRIAGLENVDPSTVRYNLTKEKRNWVSGDIAEFDDFLHAVETKSAPISNERSPMKIGADGNIIASVIVYMGGCDFPILMDRIKKHCGARRSRVYDYISAVKYAIARGLVDVVRDSNINKYELSDYGRELAGMINGARME